MACERAPFDVLIRHSRRPGPGFYLATEPIDPFSLMEWYQHIERFVDSGYGRYVSDPQYLPAWVIEQEANDRKEKERRARFDEATRQMLERRFQSNALQE